MTATTMPEAAPRLRSGSWLVLAAILGAAALAIASVAFLGTDPRPSAADRVSEVRSLEPPELPREWVWERPAIRFDHMFRAEGNQV